MYSALKHEGKRLYTLARAGKVVDRPARKVTIKSLTLVSQTADSLTFDVSCTKGTYVRTLAEDLGEALGCGAHVTFLRRVTTGPFILSQTVTIEKLESMQGDIAALDGLLHSLDLALQEYPLVSCSDSEKTNLCLGRQVHREGLQQQGLIRLNDVDGHIFGLGKWRDGDQLAPVRIFV